MINIKILDYRISNDQNQIIVNKVRKNEHNEIIVKEDDKGNFVESVNLVGYFGNINKAMNGIQRDYVLSDGTQIESIKDYKKALETIVSEFKKMTDLGEEF